jgi:hypothetical protein
MSIDCNGEPAATASQLFCPTFSNVYQDRGHCRIDMARTGFAFTSLVGLMMTVAAVNAAALDAEPAIVGDLDASGGDETGPRVVIYLANTAQIPANQLLLAQQRATDIYGNAGVFLEWKGAQSSDPVPTMTAPDSMDVYVVLAPDRLTDVICGAHRISPHAMGVAMVANRRLAYVFTDRIGYLATRKGLMPASLIGEVLAHEVGHLLLPELGHTSLGLMRANVDVRLHAPARFTDDQAAALRARLSHP